MTEFNCPHCQGLVQLDEEVPEEEVEWLGCLPWTGEEKDLPNNGQIRCPGMTVLDFIHEVVRAPVSNAVIKVVIDEDVYNTVIGVYGQRGIVLAESDGSNNLLTRKEWKDKYGTDGLALWAIKSLYHQDTGYGVKPVKVAKQTTGVVARPVGAKKVPVKIGSGR
jgi:hypothetical protein